MFSAYLFFYTWLFDTALKINYTDTTFHVYSAGDSTMALTSSSSSIKCDCLPGPCMLIRFSHVARNPKNEKRPFLVFRMLYENRHTVFRTVFSARQHAERAICYRKSVRLSVCPSVCLSVCPSHGWISQKRLNVSSKFFHQLIGPTF